MSLAMQSPPHEQAPMPGLYLLDTREELSLNHHSSPSFSLACREPGEGKKDGLPWKKDGLPERGRHHCSPRGPRSHIPLCTEKGRILHTAAALGSRRNRQPGNSKTHHHHQPSGPVKCYLCAGWEVCAPAVKAVTSRWQMLHLPAKHPSRIANKTGGH